MITDDDKSPEEIDSLEGAEDNEEELLRDIDTQEQLNNEKLIQKLEIKDMGNPEESSIITDDTMSDYHIENGTEMPEGRVGETLAQEYAKTEAKAKKPPVTKNLSGDNPPGSEDIAFNAGMADVSNEQVLYPAENIGENFRENIEKTKKEINLGKRLKKKDKP